MEGVKYSGGVLSGGYSERLGKRLHLRPIVAINDAFRNNFWMLLNINGFQLIPKTAPNRYLSRIYWKVLKTLN